MKRYLKRLKNKFFSKKMNVSFICINDFFRNFIHFFANSSLTYLHV